jgi:putative hydrolase of the HAD superfamily
MLAGARSATCMRADPPGRGPRAWLFDLDNTLHDASHAVFGMLDDSINDFIVREIGLAVHEADALRRHYWRRYGATLLGLERHHGTRAAHYLEYTHRLPGLERMLRSSRADRLAVARLRGRRYVLTNAPAAYAKRVLDALWLTPLFDGVIGIEGMRMFGKLRPKPDERMFRFVLAQLKLRPSRCVLVEDTLAHQRAARSTGMTTVWMQRYLRGSSHGPEAGVRRGRRPRYVYARINSLQELRRL